ncbi:MAG: diaminopimelate epimerase [Rhodospirillaceae bacterium]|nr:diaminopimelate epimerase [Rhodospirillaceae bacterium]
MDAVSFIKMHGLGNDFVIIDGRARAFPITEDRARTIADRHVGIGCDQVIVIEPPQDARAQAFMRVHNADGSEAGACGNGARCVGAILMQEADRGEVCIETRSGLIEVANAGPGLVRIDMGPARLDWRDIPLARPMDTLHLDLAAGDLADPVAVNVGNPHAVFFVADAEAVDLARLGPQLERDPLFPERANIEVASLIERDRLRMRVWERGAGITRACGTGACATVVAAARRNITDRAAEVVLDGGTLAIEWRRDGHVHMTGPVAWSFFGTFDDRLFS